MNIFEPHKKKNERTMTSKAISSTHQRKEEQHQQQHQYNINFKKMKQTNWLFLNTLIMVALMSTLINVVTCSEHDLELTSSSSSVNQNTFVQSIAQQH